MFNDLASCLANVFELPLIIVVNKTCFGINQVDDLALFTFDKDQTKLVMSSLLAATLIEIVTKFETTTTTKGYDKAFFITSSCVVLFGNTFKVFTYS